VLPQADSRQAEAARLENMRASSMQAVSGVIAAANKRREAALNESNALLSQLRGLLVGGVGAPSQAPRSQDGVLAAAILAAAASPSPTPTALQSPAAAPASAAPVAAAAPLPVSALAPLVVSPLPSPLAIAPVVNASKAPGAAAPSSAPISPPALLPAFSDNSLNVARFRSREAGSSSRSGSGNLLGLNVWGVSPASAAADSSSPSPAVLLEEGAQTSASDMGSAVDPIDSQLASIINAGVPGTPAPVAPAQVPATPSRAQHVVTTTNVAPIVVDSVVDLGARQPPPVVVLARARPLPRAAVAVAPLQTTPVTSFQDIVSSSRTLADMQADVIKRRAMLQKQQTALDESLAALNLKSTAVARQMAYLSKQYALQRSAYEQARQQLDNDAKKARDLQTAATNNVLAAAKAAEAEAAKRLSNVQVRRALLRYVSLSSSDLFSHRPFPLQSSVASMVDTAQAEGQKAVASAKESATAAVEAVRQSSERQAADIRSQLEADAKVLRSDFAARKAALISQVCVRCDHLVLGCSSAYSVFVPMLVSFGAV
jgi:hypothetical protein